MLVHKVRYLLCKPLPPMTACRVLLPQTIVSYCIVPVTKTLKYKVVAYTCTYTKTPVLAVLIRRKKAKVRLKFLLVRNKYLLELSIILRFSFTK